MKPIRRVAGALAALLLAGCGTTVGGTTAATDATSPGAVSGDSLSVPSAGTAPGTGGAATGSVEAPTSGAAGQPLIPGHGGSSSATTGSTGSGATGSTSAQKMGVGITSTKVYVGVMYQSGSDQANKALGNNVTSGDQKADAQAVIDDINAHGGVAGRKLVPVYYDLQTTDARPYTTIDAEMCAKFTQDNHVFAAAAEGLTDNFTACLTNAGVLQVNSLGQLIGPDKAYFEKYPYVFQMAYVSQERMMSAEVPSLVRQNYFSGWNTTTGVAANGVPAKLGVLSFDTLNWSQPLRHVMLPALARAGHAVDPSDVQEVAYPSQTTDIGSTVTQIQSAVLRFRQDGVTHVIVLDGNGSMTLYMLNNMRGQHYYPRLGINSATGAETLATQYHQDTQSFNGAVGIGWLPLLDLPPGIGDKHFTSRTKDCITMIEKRTGQSFPDTNSASIALAYCDELHLIADAAAKAGPVINRDTASAAIESFRGNFPTVGSLGLYFSPTQHDGIEYGYDLEFDESCACTKYVRGPYRIP
jgi:hypothetical protein